VSSYVLGVLLLSAMVLPPAWAATRVRRRMFPDVVGPPALVVDVVLWATQVVVIPEILGSIGLFRRFAVAGTLLTLGVAIALVCGRTSSRQATEGRARAASRPETAVALGICGLFAFPWAAWTWAAARSGSFSYDALAYHLPFAARWVQTGSTWQINPLAPDTVVAYHPASAEIVNSLAMLAFHTTVVSPFVNLLWLALLGVAAWAVGQAYGRGPHCLALAIVAADCPMLLTSQPGSAMNDLTLVALAMAAAALATQALPLRRMAVPLGLALGLVAGTKLDGLAFVVVMFIGCALVSPRADRLAVGCRLVASSAISGGFFYLRNIAAVGTPIPGLRLPLLPPVRAPLDASLGASVTHYLFSDPSVLFHYLWPALRSDFGRLWPLWLAVSIGGAAAALVCTPTRIHRVVGLAALATVAAWAVTPTSAGGLSGQPTLLGYNLRYASVGLVVGAVLLAVVPKLAARGWGWVTLGVAGLLAVTSLTPESSWPGVYGYTAAIGWKKTSLLEVLPLIALLALACIAVRHPRSREIAALGAGLGVVGVGVAGYVLQSRYVPLYFTARSSPLAPELAWSRVLHHQRIGTVGVDLIFPLYNGDLSNVVGAVGSEMPEHDFAAPASCPELRRDVDTGRYRYVVLSPNYAGGGLLSQDAWMRDASGAVLVFRAGDATVYRIDHPLDPYGCVL